MYNKEQAKLVAPLLAQPKIWAGLEEYLLLLKEQTFKALVTAQSESELRQMQGKAALLETLLKLKDSHEAIVKNGR
tara:strand:- start:360 stop:587 length:228 start_codon:yes stop_codon:yes gene_type:complete